MSNKIFKYCSKIVGVTFEGRQDTIKLLKGDEQLRVRREPDNEYDPKAVAVDVEVTPDTWRPIGYIAKDKNSEIAKSLDENQTVFIKIASLTGGDKKSYGVNIELTYEEAVAKAVKPSKNSIPLLSRLTGVTVLYDEKKHTYTDKKGNKYLSGSQFPNQFYDKFDKNQAVDMVLKAYPDAKVTKEQLLDIWNTNGNISTSFGSSVHSALENYIKYHKIGDMISKADAPNKALSKNPFFAKLVNSYVDKFGVDSLLSEEFIADELGHCGRVDCIKVVDKEKKIIRIVDFKTDTDLFETKYQSTGSFFKKLIKNEKGREDATLLTYHRFQMSYYAYILGQYGYITEGLDLDWLNPNTLEWERHSTDVIDLTEFLKGDK